MPEKRENMAFDIDIDSELKDNSEEFLAEFKSAITRALVRMGIQAQSYATDLVPVGTPESTGIEDYAGGTLRQSIQAQVDPSARTKNTRCMRIWGPHPYQGAQRLRLCWVLLPLSCKALKQLFWLFFFQ